MHGGTIRSGRSKTLAVSGVYWMSWIRSFSNTTAPSEAAMFSPTRKADSSVIEIWPFSTSAARFLMPSCRLSPPVESAIFSASGLVSR